jgi:curli biogenesis system outer membrane secretion channel CsgG
MLGLTLLAVLLAHRAFAGPLGFSVGASVSGQGVEVTRVAPGSLAQEAGLQPGDLITRCNGRPVNQPASFVAMVRKSSGEVPLRLEVSRNGWQRALELPKRTDTNPESLAVPVKSANGKPAARADGMRARATVGDFSVRAAKASAVIGEGLRDLMMGALQQSGYFHVVDRGNTPLSGRSNHAARPEVTDIMVYGIVSEFEPEAGGFGYSNFLPQAGLIVRQSSSYAELAIDIRAVDVTTGRVLVAQRIPGSAQTFSAGLGGSISGVSLPVSLNAYRGTPMEQAIRDCIEKAAFFVANNIPDRYFSYR